MNTDFKTSFLNDVKKVKDQSLKEKVGQSITDVEKANGKQDIPELRKLKGARKGIYYSIKIDHYRIGVTIENEMVTFVVSIINLRSSREKFFQ